MMKLMWILAGKIYWEIKPGWKPFSWCGWYEGIMNWYWCVAGITVNQLRPPDTWSWHGDILHFFTISNMYIAPGHVHTTTWYTTTWYKFWGHFNAFIISIILYQFKKDPFCLIIFYFVLFHTCIYIPRPRGETTLGTIFWIEAGRSYHFDYWSGNKLGGDLGEVASLQEQTSPYFQLREKSKCIDHIGKPKFWSKTFL